LTEIIGVKLISCESLEGLVVGRDVARACIQETQHLIERSVLQHELNDVFDCRELIGHR